MDGLPTALTFLTTIPLRYFSARPGAMGRAAAWFPVVGLLIGTVLVGVAWLGGHAWGPGVAAALVLGAGLLLTGGLHIDGLMDTADAFFSHKDRARMLEIMRDSRSGALGVAAGVVVMLAKYAALSHLLGHGHLWAIAVAPALGRMGIVLAAASFGSAREGGLGASFAAEVRPLHAVVAAVSAVAIAVALRHWQGVCLPALAVLVAMAVAWYSRRRLGGLTGDIYGAINELVELAVLLAAGVVWAA